MAKPADATDKSGWKVVDFRNKNPTLLRRLLRFTFGFIMVHYLLHGVVAGGILALIAYQGPLGLVIAATAVLLYLPSFFNPYHKKFGHVWLAFRDMSLWKLVQEYLHLRVIRTTPLDGKKQYIFGWHPHGIIILSRVSVYGGVFRDLFPGIDMRVLGATPMFFIPGCREVCLWLGAIDASRKTAERQLENGLSLFIYPGGSKEIFHTNATSKDTRLELSHRQGFVKLALKYGCPLVPVFVFGEKWYYNRLIFPDAVRKWVLSVLKIPLLIFWGRFGTLMPLKSEKGLGVVFGAPIDVPKIDNPTPEDIKAVQDKYTAAVKALYDTHKASFGYDDDETLTVL